MDVHFYGRGARGCLIYQQAGNDGVFCYGAILLHDLRGLTDFGLENLLTRGNCTDLISGGYCTRGFGIHWVFMRG